MLSPVRFRKRKYARGRLQRGLGRRAGGDAAEEADDVHHRLLMLRAGFQVECVLRHACASYPSSERIDRSRVRIFASSGG